MEIEKKYLMQSLPDFVKDHPCKKLTQGYICTDPVIRIRATRGPEEGKEYYVLTVKGPGFAVREEHELRMKKEAFESLLPKCSGIIIEKTRYLVPLEGGLTAEVDVFAGHHEGLILAEVEFDSVEAMEAFTAPSWMGEDVTGQSKYQNSTLSGGERT